MRITSFSESDMGIGRRPFVGRPSRSCFSGRNQTLGAGLRMAAIRGERAFARRRGFRQARQDRRRRSHCQGDRIAQACSVFLEDRQSPRGMSGSVYETSYALQREIWKGSYAVTSLIPAIERCIRRVSGFRGIGGLGRQRARRHRYRDQDRPDHALQRAGLAHGHGR